MFILALIPIQFLYLLNIILTVALPGVLFGIALQANFKKGLAIIISAAPHYVFEVFAFCLFAAVLFKLNRIVRGKIRSVFKKDGTRKIGRASCRERGEIEVEDRW